MFSTHGISSDCSTSFSKFYKRTVRNKHSLNICKTHVILSIEGEHVVRVAVDGIHLAPRVSTGDFLSVRIQDMNVIDLQLDLVT